MKHNDKAKLKKSVLNLLPARKFRCVDCSKEFPVRRGDLRVSRKYYDGPFCPWCGHKINV